MSKAKRKLARARQRAKKEKRKGDTRIYETHDIVHKLLGGSGVVRWDSPKRSCVFCDWCTDVWWDYSTGPYMFHCDKNHDTSYGYIGQCKYFREVK